MVEAATTSEVRAKGPPSITTCSKTMSRVLALLVCASSIASWCIQLYYTMDVEAMFEVGNQIVYISAAYCFNVLGILFLAWVIGLATPFKQFFNL
jgi:hypothetical protein